MKKKNIIIRYFMLLVLIATLNDDFLKSFQITVETYKGIVQLSGFVVPQKAIDKAGEIASGVKGVKSVKNNLIVKETTVILFATHKSTAFLLNP